MCPGRELCERMWLPAQVVLWMDSEWQFRSFVGKIEKLRFQAGLASIECGSSSCQKWACKHSQHLHNANIESNICSPFFCCGWYQNLLILCHIYMRHSLLEALNSAAKSIRSKNSSKKLFKFWWGLEIRVNPIEIIQISNILDIIVVFFDWALFWSMSGRNSSAQNDSRSPCCSLSAKWWISWNFPITFISAFLYNIHMINKYVLTLHLSQ